MLYADCMNCLLNKQMDQIKAVEDEKIRSDYIRDVMKLIASADKPAPAVIEDINKLHAGYFGAAYSYEKIKKEYNDYLLSRENVLAERIGSEKDPLLAALKLAMTGNYIDFAYMGSVDKDKLESLIASYPERKIDNKLYDGFLSKLSTGKKLLYISDNCGEIVLDKIFISEIKKAYPKLKITLLTRGKPVINDAVKSDAEYIGMDKLCTVMDNGTAVAGTYLSEISAEAARAIREADTIISKGQGNYETLMDAGLGIYFIFLCKCSHFTRRFGLDKFDGVFCRQ